MIQTSQRIGRALEHAEATIREIGAEAFRAGDDNLVGQAHEIVGALKSLRVNLNGRTPPSAASTPRENPSKPQKKGKKNRAGKSRQSEYPKYRVRNGSLIRVGWSKKQKSEYEHKASREAFDRTIAAVAEIAATGPGPFTAEQIIERVNDSDNSFPGYQVYVVIGLLREHGCVEQVGRDGYMVPQDLASRASHVWNQLAEKSK